MDGTDVFGMAQNLPEHPAAGAGAGSNGATGRSPDGIGATAMPVGGELPWLEPDDVSPSAAMRSAGVTVLASAVAFGAGLAIAGPWAAGAGVLLLGSVFNGYRAQKWWGSPDPSAKHEAVVSGVMAAVGVGVGGWMAWKSSQES